MDAKFRLVEALLSRTRQVAPRLPLVRIWRLRPGTSPGTSGPSGTSPGWVVDHWAFGYHWQEHRALSADIVPVGRLWLVGAGILVRRYDWAKGGTQVFSGVDFEKQTTVGLEVTSSGDEGGRTLTVLGQGHKARIDYDPLRGGPVRVTTFDGSVYEAGARPFSVPYVQVPAKATDVQPFSWPRTVARKDIEVRSEDGTMLRGSLAVPGTRVEAVAILVPAMGRLDRDGRMGSRRPYAFLAAAISQRLRWAVLTYDRRGVGRSSGSYASVSLDSEVADLAGWLSWIRRNERLRRVPLVLIAHAEGVYPALRAAARLGRRLRALAFVEPVGRPYDRVILKRFEREWLFGGLSAQTMEKRRAYLEKSLASIRGGRFDGKLWLAGPVYPVRWLKDVLGFDLRRAARRVRCPVLLLRGSADVFSSEADEEALATALKGRRRVSRPRPVMSVGRFFQHSPYRIEVAPEEWLLPSSLDSSYVSALLDWLRRLR